MGMTERFGERGRHKKRPASVTGYRLVVFIVSSASFWFLAVLLSRDKHVLSPVYDSFVSSSYLKNRIEKLIIIGHLFQ